MGLAALTALTAVTKSVTVGLMVPAEPTVAARKVITIRLTNTEADMLNRLMAASMTPGRRWSYNQTVVDLIRRGAAALEAKNEQAAKRKGKKAPAAS